MDIARLFQSSLFNVIQGAQPHISPTNITSENDIATDKFVSTHSDEDPPSIDELIRSLSSSNVEERIRAIQSLGRIQDSPQAVTALITALRDTDFNVRGDAATALGRIGQGSP